jgi:hypothetical protein
MRSNNSDITKEVVLFSLSFDPTIGFRADINPGLWGEYSGELRQLVGATLKMQGENIAENTPGLSQTIGEFEVSSQKVIKQ